MKLRFSIYPRELLFAFFIFMLPLSLAVEMNFSGSVASYFAYTDEVLCILCSIYLAYFMFKHKIKGTNFVTLVILIILILLGFLSNIVSGVINDWFPIIVDAICLAKIFVPFIIYRQIAVFDKKRMIARYLVGISKLLIIVGTFFGILTQFIDLGMSTGSDKRYGIVPYCFIFGNQGRYGYIIICALLFIFLVEKSKKKLLFCEILGLANVILTTKGVVYVSFACYIILLLMWRKDTKLSPGKIAVLGIGSVLISTTQINTYLADFESPRVTLIKYGFVTANNYFPLGSGFATYGSDMAAEYYSTLYKLYGFQKIWGLSIDYPMFLNDCYMGMVFGQFGYFGTILFVLLVILVFIPIKNIVLDKRTKALAFSLFIGIVVSAIATAIIKSSIGVMIFATLGTICGYSEQQLETDDNISIINNRKTVTRLKMKVKNR